MEMERRREGYVEKYMPNRTRGKQLRGWRISKRLKGKVMSTFVTPACLHGTETLALTEIAYNNKGVKCAKTTCYEKIVRVRLKGADRRRKVELRE